MTSHLPVDLVLWTRELPGIGGSIKNDPDDFVVEEIPLYDAVGEGEHVYLWVEKRDVAHKDLLRRLARHFRVDERAIGAAGMKDRRAVTRQWVSIHDHALDPAATVGAIDGQIEVLEARRHQNKLKTGHLTGNRFRVRVRGIAAAEAAEERAQAILDELTRVGVPNYFGTQRFGRDLHTLRLGLDLVRGDPPARLRKDKWLRRLAASAAQSAVFNRVLADRILAGTSRTPLLGDRLDRVGVRGQLVVTAENIDEARAGIEAKELVVTGPMPGPKMYDTYEEAADVERAAMAKFDVGPEAFAALHKDAPGTRRAFFVSFLEPPEFRLDGVDSAWIGFSLPSGAYATVVLAELTKWDFSAWEAT